MMHIHYHDNHRKLDESDKVLKEADDFCKEFTKGGAGSPLEAIQQLKSHLMKLEQLDDKDMITMQKTWVKRLIKYIKAQISDLCRS